MFYLLDKQKGQTSFKAIRDFAKKHKIAKIGHTGTLDPLATGLLLVATDEDTKLIEYIDKGFKTYVASMVLGKTSDTYDIEGEIKEITNQIIDESVVLETLKSFEGVSMQTPPSFSAKKINGAKAYDLARAGTEVVLKPVEVEIKDIKDFKKIGQNEFSFQVTVSRGTYIRSIIHDLGQILKCGAIMSDLRRTKIGEHEIPNDEFQEINVIDLLTLPTIKISKMQDLIHGKEVKTDVKNGIYALEYDKDIFGIVQVENNIAKGLKLLGNKFKKAGF